MTTRTRSQSVLPVLDTADFALRREIIELMRFTFQLEKDDGVTAIYIKWNIHLFRCKVGEDPSPWKTLIRRNGVPPVSPSLTV